MMPQTADRDRTECERKLLEDEKVKTVCDIVDVAGACFALGTGVA